MEQKRKEILQFYKDDVESASKETEEGELFSEYDEVRILYMGHYPQFRDDFNLIEKKLKSFFTFGD